MLIQVLLEICTCHRGRDARAKDLGLRVLDLLSRGVLVLAAVRLLAALLAWALVVLDVLVVDGHGLLDLQAEGLVVRSPNI